MNIQQQYKSLSNTNFKPEKINIPSNFSGLTNFSDFKIKYSNKNWKLSPQYVRLYDFLSRIQEQYTNWLDPIEYLYYLYYEIKISTIDIFNELWYLWNYRNNEYFVSMFKKIFWWKLRNPNTQTDLRREKDQNKVKWITQKLKLEKEDKIENVEKILNRISKNKNKTPFLKTEFSDIKNIRNRTKYILDINWYIKEDSFKKTLIKLSNKYGIKVTASAITNILESETNKIWNIDKIYLRAWRIIELKNEQN